VTDALSGVVGEVHVLPDENGRCEPGRFGRVDDRTRHSLCAQNGRRGQQGRAKSHGEDYRADYSVHGGSQSVQQRTGEGPYGDKSNTFSFSRRIRGRVGLIPGPLCRGGLFEFRDLKY